MSSSFRIGINAYEANVAKRVGSNMYAYRLLCELERLTRDDTEQVGPVVRDRTTTYEWIIYLPSEPLSDMPKERPGWKYRVIGPQSMWTQWRLPLELYLHPDKLSVFVSLGHYAPRFCPVPSVVCILDLAFLKFPQFFLKKDLYKLTAWTKYSVMKAAHIFTISMSSKKDIVDAYGIQDKDISIIYPGVECSEEHAKEENVLDVPSVLDRYGLQAKNYIVSVGTIQPRKNMINAIKAFEQLEGDTKLVFVGKAGWMTEEFDQAVANSSKKDSIVVTGFIEDKDKYALLQQAGCSVLIGYYEGFGIPAVESLAYGVTPVVAKTASLPEVVGEYGILVDPHDPQDIAKGFTVALANLPDPMQRSKMHTWSQRFSWQESGSTMLDVLTDRFFTKL